MITMRNLFLNVKRYCSPLDRTFFRLYSSKGEWPDKPFALPPIEKIRNRWSTSRIEMSAEMIRSLSDKRYQSVTEFEDELAQVLKTSVTTDRLYGETFMAYQRAVLGATFLSGELTFQLSERELTLILLREGFSLSHEECISIAHGISNKTLSQNEMKKLITNILYKSRVKNLHLSEFTNDIEEIYQQIEKFLYKVGKEHIHSK